MLLVSHPTESPSRGVNPFCSDAAGSRSAELILTLTTHSSHRPARRCKCRSARLARCAYSLTIPLVALLVLRFTCLTPSVRPYYVPRCSLLLVLVLPPPPKSMLLADREFSLRLAAARVTSFLSCPFFSLSLSRPFCSSHVAEEEEEEVFELHREKKRGLFIATKISVYRLGRFREEKREIRWIKCEPISYR